MLVVAGTGTYYELLDVNADCGSDQVKKSFYAFARKFHPDRHMGNTEWMDSLQQLMGTATMAYKTLTDDEKRTAYDKKLAASKTYHLDRNKTEAGETLEDCAERANELLRAKNYPGSVFWLRKCVELAPESSKYRTLLAYSLSTLAPYRKEAIEQLEKAIELDPWNATACVQLGEIYERMELPGERSLSIKRRWKLIHMTTASVRLHEWMRKRR